MFGGGIPEGLPPPIAPEPACRPRSPRPHPIPMPIKAPIVRNFDHFSEHYRRETLPAMQDVPFVVCEWLKDQQNIVVYE